MGEDRLGSERPDRHACSAAAALARALPARGTIASVAPVVMVFAVLIWRSQP